MHRASDSETAKKGLATTAIASLIAIGFLFAYNNFLGTVLSVSVHPSENTACSIIMGIGLDILPALACFLDLLNNSSFMYHII